MKSFLTFLKNGRKESDHIDHRWLVMLRLYFLVIIFSFISYSMAFLLASSFKSPKRQTLLHSNPGLTVAIISLLIYPILEELMFRLPLGSFDIKTIKLSFGLIIGYFSIWLLSSFTELNLGVEKNLVSILLVALVVYLTITFFSPHLSFVNLEVWWNNHLSKITLLFSVLFAFAHFQSFFYRGFVFGIENFLVTLFLGLVLAYVRVNMGIRESIIFHIFSNLPNWLFVFRDFLFQ